MAIDRRSWILGGILAGLIMNVSGVVLGHAVLGEEYIGAMRSHMASPPSIVTVVKNIGLRLGFGLLAVFLYAGFRPRFGPGPKTAVVAGVVLWLAVHLPAAIALSNFGILTGWRLWVDLAWTLAEACVATVAGAWIYREWVEGAGQTTPV